MDEKPRLNPFSISNILSNNTTTRKSENKELSKPIDHDHRGSKTVLELDEESIVGRELKSYPTLKEEKSKTSDLYDWEDDSCEQSSDKGDFDGKNMFLM